jgi:uncharacterized membrane protein YkvA (DUF1232 family)
MINNAIDTFLDAFYKKFQQLYGNPDVKDLIHRFFDKIGNFTENFYGLQDHLLALGRMLNAWYRQEYRNISPATVATLIAAVIYIVNPLDLVPDFLPFIGQIDDLLIISLVIRRLNKEIERFMAWEKELEN